MILQLEEAPAQASPRSPRRAASPRSHHHHHHHHEGKESRGSQAGDLRVDSVKLEKDKVCIMRVSIERHKINPKHSIETSNNQTNFNQRCCL